MAMLTLILEEYWVTLIYHCRERQIDDVLSKPQKNTKKVMSSLISSLRDHSGTLIRETQP
jgi:hypothetical protein